MSTQYAITLGLYITAFAVIIILFAASILGGNREKPIFRWFYYLTLFSLLAFVMEIIVGVLQGMWQNLWQDVFGVSYGVSYELVRPIIVTADYLTYIFITFQMFAFAMYLYVYLQTKTKISKMPIKLSIILCGINILLATVSQFRGIYSSFDEFNNYQRHDLFWISSMFPILVLTIVLITTLVYAKVLKPKELVILLIYQLLPMGGNIVEIAIPNLWLAHVTAAFTILLIYVSIHVELMQQVTLHEAQLDEGKIAIMLSQIQPHFLYNVLNTIDDLVYHNEEKAHQAIYAFSDYLRSNMNSLTKRELIPFSEELKHTRQYLWLEQLRFEDRLKVIYDIKTENFKIPVLTLQPMAENAVRYGTSKETPSSMITIRTEEYEFYHRITVMDNGDGFDPSALPKDSRNHTGIDNVRNRLQLMCNGKLTISSEQGKGTTVTIDIPK